MFLILWSDIYFDTSALLSVNWGHYFAKEGCAIIIGAETAQCFINVNTWYAFIRGACKQYGVLSFGNVSCFNRWGHKIYDKEGKTEDSSWSEYGPDSGTSLSLMHRLLYTFLFLYGRDC